MELDYISALPGTGKTKWAVTKMADWIRDPDGYYMYVAPSSALLREVRNYMLKYLDPKYHNLVELIDGKSVDNKVTDRIAARLTGSVSKFGTTKRAPKGTVFLVTHAAFLLLKKVPNSKHVHLIFDEARKCITQPYVLKMTDEQRKKVFSLFKVSPVDKDFAKARSKQPLLKVTAAIQALSLKPKTTSSLLKLAQATENPRLEVFLSNDKTSNTFEVILPSVIFEGFKSVTLMSAFFEDSQMFHLLKKRKVRMTNITEVALQNYKYRTSRIKKRYSKIDLVALCPDVESVLSKTKLDGLLVSLKHEEKILTALNSLGVHSKKDLELLKSSLTDSNFEGTEAIEGFKRAWMKNPDLIHTDPILWLVKATNRVICDWGVKNSYTKRPLLILNAKQRTQLKHKLPQYNVETTNLHGLNEYLEHNVVAFLAAVNPSKKMISFYKKYLPGYEQAKDHVAEVCVQCVCRISIRDIKAKDRTLVIVPDNGISSLLSQKMNGRPRVRPELEPKVSMSFVGLDRKGKTKVPKVKVSASQRFQTWLQDPVNVVLNKLRVRLAYYKKKDSDKFTEIEKVVAQIKETRTIPKELAHLAVTKPRGKFI